MDLPSPRAGEIPPALSPLDAFALHSRALARKLEESDKAGRRMSRLPHQDIADELAKRPGYFRSVSSGVESLYDDDQEEERAGEGADLDRGDALGADEQQQVQRQEQDLRQHQQRCSGEESF